MIAVYLLAISLAALPAAGVAAAAQQVRAAGSGQFEQLSQAADKARDEGRDDDAIRLYKEALSKRPEWEQGLWYLGNTYYGKGQYFEARDVFRHFMTLRPDAGPGWALLGLSEFQTREYSRALDHLQRSMALGMGENRELIQSVFYSATVLLIRLERYDDGMNMLLKMAATDSNPSQLVEPAGLAGLRLPLLPAEIPPDRRALIQLAGEGVIALRTHRYEDAEAKFKQMVERYPNEAGVHFLYGAYLMQRHPDEGIREMKLELQNSPSHVLARVRLAEQYLAQQQSDEALQLAQEAAKLDPKRASPHMLAGEALQAKGDLAAALKEFEISRDDDSMNTRIHWDLMRAYNAAGRTDDAKREKAEIEKLSSSESNGASPQGDKTE
jgi:tetratricopeptide (TPR) repeat protein